MGGTRLYSVFARAVWFDFSYGRALELPFFLDLERGSSEAGLIFDHSGTTWTDDLETIQRKERLEILTVNQTFIVY